MVLISSALALTIVGCSGSDGPTGETGSLEGQVVLNENPNGELGAQIDTIRATLECDGTDPWTGEPFATEVFDIDVSTTQNTPGTKPQLGVFKKEGIPIGSNCRVTLVAMTVDGATQCGGQGHSGPIPPPPTNGQLSITLNCITAARYGGLRVDGTFNRCMEYQQILVKPVTQSVGNDIGVEIWCADPDGDDGLSSIFFVTEASFNASPQDPSSWDTCSADTIDLMNPLVPQPYLNPCPTQDGPVVDPDAPAGEPNLVAASTTAALTCDVVDDCVVVVNVSDDNFANGGADPFGCNGFYPDGRPDYNAFSVIPVECEGQSVCGNGIQEPGEQCDIEGVDVNGPLFVAADPNTWCSTRCRTFEPCTDSPAEEPTNCPPIQDAQCQAQMCDDSAMPSCTIMNLAGSCDLTPGSGAADGVCDMGMCVKPPDCEIPSDCGVDTQCQIFDCVDGVCDVDSPGTCELDGVPGTCQPNDGEIKCGAGACTNESDLAQLDAEFPPANTALDPIDVGGLAIVCVGNQDFITLNVGEGYTCNDYGVENVDSCCFLGTVLGCSIDDCWTNNGLTSACGNCYAGVADALACANICTDTEALECQQCLWENGVTQGVADCSGLLADTPPGCDPACRVKPCVCEDP
jgi:hypothetical protein